MSVRVDAIVILFSLFCLDVYQAAFSFSDSNHVDKYFLIIYLIDKPITYCTQFYFIYILEAPQLAARNTWVQYSFVELFLELILDGRSEFFPFFQRAWEKFDFIDHQFQFLRHFLSHVHDSSRSELIQHPQAYPSTTRKFLLE